MPDRIALPGGVGIFRKRAAVGEDLAIPASLGQKPYDTRSLEDLIHAKVQLGTDHRHAAVTGRILALVFDALFVECFRPRLDFTGFQIPDDIRAVAARIAAPD